MLLLISLSLGSFSTLAGQNPLLPGNYPEKFDLVGIAHEINRTGAYINVNAHHYPLAPTARFYTLKSAINNLSKVKKGTTVGMVFDTKERVMSIYEVPVSMYVAD